jgi:DnaJ-class molecular chaperone
MQSTGAASVTCPCCRGHGVDPYALTVAQSRCEACDGQGEIAVPVPHVRCAYCRGTGTAHTFRCPVCIGAGVLAPVPVPARRCADCLGRAMDPTNGWPCQFCRGRGLIPAAAEAPPPSLPPTPVSATGGYTLFAPSTQTLHSMPEPGAAPATDAPLPTPPV